MDNTFTVDGEEFSLEKSEMTVKEILELAGKDAGTCDLVEIGVETETGLNKFGAEETVTVSAGSCFSVTLKEASVA